MKKIPTLFEREFEGHKVKRVLPNVTKGMEWVLDGEGVATVKWDGACCAIIDGEFYKRFDAKQGRKAPEGAIPCCAPDPITGHHPHWIKCDRKKPEDKWFWAAYDNTNSYDKIDRTYEAVGKHFNGNPYQFEIDVLIPHGVNIIHTPLVEQGSKIQLTDLHSYRRTFKGIRDYLRANYIEGIVFWKDGEPQCKIKRTDFNFEWNGKS